MIKEEFGIEVYNDLVANVDLETTSRLALNEQHIYGSSRLGVKRVDDEILQVILNGSPIVYETVQAGLNVPGYTYYGEEEPGDEEPPSGPEPEPEVFIKYRINRTRGYKQYELTNHLGNVMVTLSDRKVGVPNTAQTHYTSYTADVYTAQEYFAFGSPIEERKFSGGEGYRYGFNTQEKTDEISGSGNHNTALFWEYDTRLGRRWNLDPKPNASISQYSVFAGNPILFTDLLGDTIRFKEGSSQEFIDKTNEYISKIRSTEEGASVIAALENSIKTFTIEEVSSLRDQSFTPTRDANGSLTGDGTIRFSLGNYKIDGVKTNGLYSFAHEVYHGFQLNSNPNSYLAMRETKSLNGETMLHEVQAVGFENYIRASLNEPGFSNPRLHYSTPVKSGGTTHTYSLELMEYTKNHWGCYFLNGKDSWDKNDFLYERKSTWIGIQKAAYLKSLGADAISGATGR